MSSSTYALRPNPIIPFPISPKTLILAGTLTPNSDHHHGPSLRPLPPDSIHPSSSNLDRPSFSRTFLIPALRIPSPSSSSLEHHLRGHLLNWPRIPNIARLPNDDPDPRLQSLLRHNSHANEHSIGKDFIPPVLYRERIAKEFNCRGFLRFRNLARISRPKRRKRVEGEGMDRGKERERVYVVREVVEEEEEDGGRWRGSTRLLLLDERYRDRVVEEMPEAVKV